MKCSIALLSIVLAITGAAPVQIDCAEDDSASQLQARVATNADLHWKLVRRSHDGPLKREAAVEHDCDEEEDDWLLVETLNEAIKREAAVEHDCDEEEDDQLVAKSLTAAMKREAAAEHDCDEEEDDQLLAKTLTAATKSEAAGEHDCDEDEDDLLSRM